MIILGLTGSIGMGKSTTGRMFADEGALLWDADAAVHRLYARGGAAVEPLGQAFPGVVVDGAVDRARLAEALGRDETAFKRLEAIVHPLVAQDRAQDLAAARARGLTTVDGLAMLIGQATPSFTALFRRPPPSLDLRALLLAHLGEAA